jgi:hypothetical protein
VNETGADRLIGAQRLESDFLHGAGDDDAIDLVKIIGATVGQRLFAERHHHEAFAAHTGCRLTCHDRALGFAPDFTVKLRYSGMAAKASKLDFKSERN